MKTFRILTIASLIVMLNGCLPDDSINTLEGSWSCQETSEIFMGNMKGTTIYPVYFAQDVLESDKYYIDNFYHLGDGVEVSVRLSGSVITLDKQTVDGFEFEGSGTVNTAYDRVELSYTADDGGDEIDHVQATYTR